MEKEKINVDEFYSKIIRIANRAFQSMCEIPGINMGNNRMYHMKLRQELREWAIEELLYEYEIEV